MNNFILFYITKSPSFFSKWSSLLFLKVFSRNPDATYILCKIQVIASVRTRSITNRKPHPLAHEPAPAFLINSIPNKIDPLIRFLTSWKLYYLIFRLCLLAIPDSVLRFRWEVWDCHLWVHTKQCNCIYRRTNHLIYQFSINNIQDMAIMKHILGDKYSLSSEFELKYLVTYFVDILLTCMFLLPGESRIQIFNYYTYKQDNYIID